MSLFQTVTTRSTFSSSGTIKHCRKTQYFRGNDSWKSVERSVQSRMVGYFFNRLKYRDLDCFRAPCPGSRLDPVESPVNTDGDFFLNSLAELHVLLEHRVVVPDRLGPWPSQKFRLRSHGGSNPDPDPDSEVGRTIFRVRLRLQVDRKITETQC